MEKLFRRSPTWNSDFSAPKLEFGSFEHVFVSWKGVNIVHSLLCCVSLTNNNIQTTVFYLHSSFLNFIHKTVKNTFGCVKLLRISLVCFCQRDFVVTAKLSR